MTQEKKKSNKCKIVLPEDCREILLSWRAILEEKFQGIKISNTDLVVWLLKKTGANLSKKDISDLKNTFFDQVQQLQWLLAKAKAAKLNDETLSELKVPLL